MERTDLQEAPPMAILFCAEFVLDLLMRDSSTTELEAIQVDSHFCKIKRRGIFLFKFCAVCTGKLYHSVLPLRAVSTQGVTEGAL